MQTHANAHTCMHARVHKRTYAWMHAHTHTRTAVALQCFDCFVFLHSVSVTLLIVDNFVVFEG